MQKGLYAIKLQDGSEIQIAFTTWVLKQFSLTKGYNSVDEIFVYLFGDKATGQKALLIKDDFVTLMYLGAKYMHLKHNKPFEYSELDAWDWLEDIGGLASPKIQDMIVLLYACALNQDADEVAKTIETKLEEKKRNPGTASTSEQQKQGSSRGKLTRQR